MSRNPARPWRREAAVALALAVVTLGAFWRVTGCGFVNFDDDLYVTGNARVRAGLTPAGIRWAFTTLENCNWHPLTWLSHMLDCQWFGVTAGPQHLVSLLLHVITTCLLFAVFVRMSGALWRSAVVAALFGLHPLHVESVAWISERKDVLSGCLWMLTTWAYVEAARRGGARRRALALLGYGLAILAKPMAVTLPFVLLLLDLWPLRRLAAPAADPDAGGRRGRAAAAARPARVSAAPPATPGALLLEKVPYLVLAAFSAVMTVVAQQRGGAVHSLAHLPLAPRLANATVSYAAYLGRLLWPSRLCVFYPFRMALPASAWLGAAALLLAISVVAVAQWRARPWLAVGWAWYLGTLVPVIGLVQVGSQAMADRYMYLPSVGLFVMLVWSAAELAGRLRLRAAAVAPVVVVALAALALLTRVQTGVWADSPTLYRHALAVTEHNATIEKNYGVTLQLLGRYGEAKPYLDAAVRDDPAWADARYNRGLVNEGLGDLEAAARDYAQAARLEPDHAGAHLRLGAARFHQGRFDEALAELETAVRCDSMDADARDAFGAALATRGRYPEAAAQLRRALALRPDFADARRNLEQVLDRIRPGGPSPR